MTEHPVRDALHHVAEELHELEHDVTEGVHDALFDPEAVAGIRKTFDGQARWAHTRWWENEPTED